jgi:ribosomal protein S18 acetylase RimI-like enzyme
MEIREVDTNGQRLAEVLAIHKSNRRVLGFLPDEGFRDRARQGTLLAAVDGGTVAGYVLYDLPGDTVKIVHLCVAGTRRRSGVARALIEHLDVLHPDRRCLQLACRRDFPADALWPKLGFSPVSERTGRSRAQHPLTIWQRSHDHVDLFTLIDERRAIAAIDCNVFKDLTTTRSQGRTSRHLRDDWVSELIELRVTEELFHEINRCEDRELRERMQRDASAFGRLPSAKGAWRALVPSVAELAPSAGEADHRQVARAIAANARYFVTRDGELLKATQSVQERLGMLVTRPEDLILHLDRLRYSGGYEPQALQATSISRIDIDRLEQTDLVAAFLNYGAGERASRLQELLRPALAAPRDHGFHVFCDADGRLLGVLILAASREHLEVKLMRVSTGGKLAGAVARQLAFLPRREAAERRLGRVLVTDPAPPEAVSEALRDEFYIQDGKEWACEVRRGLVEVARSTDDEADGVAQVADAERRHWPQKLIGGALPTFMLSIHPTYAAQLFESSLAEGTLFGRDLTLGLSREHVYYRGCGWDGGLRVPARLLWYVKGSKQTGDGYLAAASTLLEVTKGRPRSLHQRFARFGVWSRQEVERAAGKKAHVMALRFADTELLERRVELRELREIYASAGLQFEAPQSPRRVPEHMFCLLYKRASTYAT